jgi:hypothetical protein
MSGRYNIVKEFIVKPAAKAVKKIFNKQKTTGQTVNPFKYKSPKTKSEKESRDFKISLKKRSGEFKRSYMPTIHKIDETSADLRRLGQKFKGEKQTKSGISKVKDMKK